MLPRRDAALGLATLLLLLAGVEALVRAGKLNAAIVPPPYEDKYPEPGMFGPLPATGFFIRNAKNVDISHAEIVTLASDVRPGFWMQNVDGFDASFLKLPTGGPAFALDNVSGFRTFGSRAVPDKRFDAATKTSF